MSIPHSRRMESSSHPLLQFSQPPRVDPHQLWPRSPPPKNLQVQKTWTTCQGSTKSLSETWIWLREILIWQTRLSTQWRLAKRTKLLPICLTRLLQWSLNFSHWSAKLKMKKSWLSASLSTMISKRHLRGITLSKKDAGLNPSSLERASRIQCSRPLTFILKALPHHLLSSNNQNLSRSRSGIYLILDHQSSPNPKL